MGEASNGRASAASDAEERELAHALRGLQVGAAGLLFGVLSFFGLVVVLSQRGAPAQPAGDSGPLLIQLTAAAGLLAPSAWLAAGVLHRAFAQRLRALDPRARRGAEGLRLYRTAVLLPLALCEGTALFGLVVLLLGSLQGGLRDAPLLWVNALYSLGLVVALAVLFPTPERARALLSGSDPP
ncbi:MAG: hypothetical protein D6731_18250 [Planctomycetota bacterium]|nr:MAG: hypothetical protein D6731_18250 [Planctomycetota bacterium]